MFKIAISNIAWDECLADDVYRFLKEERIDLEIAPGKVISHFPNFKDADVYLLKEKLVSTYGLDIVSMQSILFGVTAEMFKSSDEQRIIFDCVKRAIDCAELLECPNIVFGSPKNRNTFTEANYIDGIHFFRKLGEYAYLHNTILSIEANPKIYGTNYINNTEEAFELASQVKSKGFKVNVDLGTMIENGETFELLEKYAEWINHIHISEPYLECILKRVEHHELANVLKKINYEKYISIEMKQQELKQVMETIFYVKEVFYEI